VIKQCGCSDAYYPADEAEAFDYVTVPVCSVNNITQGMLFLFGDEVLEDWDFEDSLRTKNQDNDLDLEKIWRF